MRQEAGQTRLTTGPLSLKTKVIFRKAKKKAYFLEARMPKSHGVWEFTLLRLACNSDDANGPVIFWTRSAGAHAREALYR